MGMNLPADVWVAPGGAGIVAAAAVFTAFTVASLRQRAFRFRGIRRTSSPSGCPQAEMTPDASSDVPLLQGKYRNRPFQMSFSAGGLLTVTLGLTTHQAGLEIGAGAPYIMSPFSSSTYNRLNRLPAPWSLAIRGKRLWLSVPGDGHDPLLMRRRLELACDLADEWDKAATA